MWFCRDKELKAYKIRSERINEIYDHLDGLYKMEFYYAGCNREKKNIRLKIRDNTYSISADPDLISPRYYCEVFNLDTRQEPDEMGDVEELLKYLRKLDYEEIDETPGCGKCRKCRVYRDIMKSVNKHDYWPSWLSNLMGDELWDECSESDEDESN